MDQSTFAADSLSRSMALGLLPPGWLMKDDGSFVDTDGANVASNPALQFIERERRIVEDESERPAWLEGFTAPPPRLRFKAWFNEESGGRSSLIRREVSLTLDTRSCELSVDLQGSESSYVVSSVTDARTKREKTFMDLHVGAKVDIMGKVTTLAQADLATTQWIQAEAQHLQVLTGRIGEQLRKYGAHPKGSSTASVHIQEFRRRNNQHPASWNLAELTSELEELVRQLRTLRPKAAQLWSSWAQLAGQRKHASEASKTMDEARRQLKRAEGSALATRRR